MTSRKRVGHFTIIFAIAFLLCLIAYRVLQRDVSPEGGSDPIFSVLLPLILVWVGSVIAILSGLVRMISPRRRATGSLVLAGGLLFSVGFPATIWLSQETRMEAFLQLGERLMPLVEAIEEFHVENGEYPQSLEDLVPRYLQRLPETNMGNYKEYRYLVGAEAERYDGNPWLIVMRVYQAMKFDLFLYFPLQNYPSSGYGGSIERLGKWAYVHE